jgi:hypothetical protein
MSSEEADARVITATVREVALAAAERSPFVRMPADQVPMRTWNAARGHAAGVPAQAHEQLRQYRRHTNAHATWRQLLQRSVNGPRRHS